MSKVAYLLGAGASYGKRGKLPLALQPPISSDVQNPQEGILRGLPILQEFASAIEQLLVELLNDEFLAEIKYLSSNVLNPLLNVSNNYPTIDTYAKLLYSTKREDEYTKFKNQLSLFFLIWQRLHKQDLRYDSFISSLVDADTCQLPELTILSWNYDVQMEMAYEGYITNANLWEIWEALNVYCKTNPHFPFDINKPFAFIKLNGSAMFHSLNRNEWTLRYDLKDIFQFKDNEKEFWKNMYELNINGNLNGHSNEYINEYINELSYAWEHKGEDALLDTISTRVVNTEVLVIIGYSFPYVNRKYDRHIFNSMTQLKKIYIQDKNPKYIEDRIKAIYQFLDRPLPEIQTSTDISQFIIPNELG